MPHRIAATGQAAGLAMMAWGVLGDGHVSEPDMRAIGVVTALCSTIWYCMTRARHCEEVLVERGRLMGYDEGYMDGRRIARPVAVPMLVTERESHPLINGTSP